jgi:hypothetical protein
MYPPRKQAMHAAQIRAARHRVEPGGTDTRLGSAGAIDAKSGTDTPSRDVDRNVARLVTVRRGRGFDPERS